MRLRVKIKKNITYKACNKIATSKMTENRKLFNIWNFRQVKIIYIIVEVKEVYVSQYNVGIYKMDKFLHLYYYSDKLQEF